MAELNVQPKKKSTFLPWLLLLLVLAALAWFFINRNKNNEVSTTATTVSDSTMVMDNTDWNGIDFNAPSLSYEEISDKNINVRGNDKYGIYGLGENILFDEGKATLRPDAEANLKQISTSIGKRYANGQIRIYGYTDSIGTADANKQLAQQRADAVKTWMQSNGIGADKISVNAVGAEKPVASNSTETGRQQNRRVEIVARTK